MPKWLASTLLAIGRSDIRNFILIMDGFIILGLLYLVCLRPIPVGSKEIVYMALGVALGVYASGRNYLFGQSKSENEKNKTP